MTAALMVGQLETQLADNFAVELGIVKAVMLVEVWDDALVVELESNSVVQLVAAKACLSGVMSVEWKDVN